MSKYLIKIGDTDFISKQGTYPDDTKDILDIKIFDDTSSAQKYLDNIGIDYNDKENEIEFVSSSDIVKLTDDGIEFNGEKEYPINNDPDWESKTIKILDYFDVDFDMD